MTVFRRTAATGGAAPAAPATPTTGGATPAAPATAALLAVGAPLALMLLALLFMESTRFSGPWRRAITLDPVTYHQGLGLLVLLAVPFAAWLAWRLGGAGHGAASGPGPVLARLVPGSGPRLRALYVGLLAAYTVAVAVSSSGSQAPDAATPWYALRVAMVPAQVALFGFLLPAVLRRADWEVVIRALTWLLAAFAVLSLTWMLLGRQDFLGLPLSVPPDDRGGRWASSGFFVHRNTIGGFLALVIPCGAWLAWTQAGRGERRGAAMTVALVVLLAGWLVLTFSRSSQLAIAAAAGVFVPLMAWTAVPGSPAMRTTLSWLRRATLVAAASALLAGLAVTLIILSSPTLQHQVVIELNGRAYLWMDVLTKTEAHRWIGAGYLGVEAEGPAGRQYGQVYDPHSAWLAQLVYFGIPGLAALVVLVGTMVAEGFRRYRREVRIAPQQALLVAAIAGVLLQNVFEYFLTDPLLFSSAFALLLLGWWRTGLREAEGESESETEGKSEGRPARPSPA